MKETIQNFFDVNTFPFYLLGFIVFLVTLLDDFANPKKKIKSVWWYLQDLLYTTLAVAIGISGCYIVEAPKSVCWITVIICGFVGSTIMRKLDSKKEKICNNVIDKTSETIIDGINNKLENHLGKLDSEKEQEDEIEINTENQEYK